MTMEHTTLERFAAPGTTGPHATAERWLFVDASPDFGGHEVMLLRWLDELKADASVTPLLLGRRGSRLLERADAVMQVEPFTPGRGRVGRARAEWKALKQVIAAHRPEVVVFVSGTLANQMMLATLARSSGARTLVYVPLVDTFQAMGYSAARFKDGLIRWWYSRVPHGWIVLSADQARHFGAWAAPRGPVFVLPNTVAKAMDAALPVVVRRPAPDGRLRVLVLGRLDAAQKGLDLLLDHLSTAPLEITDHLRFCITGEGPYKAAIEQWLAEHPSRAECLVLGDWMPPTQAMSDADVLLLPSRFEGVPLVMLEAMALGLPVVASDLPGTRAYVPAEQLFPVGDLHRAFRILLDLTGRDERERLARAGRLVYEQTASGKAFAAAVRGLTHDIRRAFAAPPTEPPESTDPTHS